MTDVVTDSADAVPIERAAQQSECGGERCKESHKQSNIFWFNRRICGRMFIKCGRGTMKNKLGSGMNVGHQVGIVGIVVREL